MATTTDLCMKPIVPNIILINSTKTIFFVSVNFVIRKLN